MAGVMAGDGVGGVAQVQVAREREVLGAGLPLAGTRNLGQVFLPLNVYSAHLQVRHPQLRGLCYSLGVRWGWSDEVMAEHGHSRW